MSDLVKLALNPNVVSAMTRSVKGFGSGAGMGGLVGAGVGGVLGAVRGADQADERGQSRVGGGIAGAARGAIRGGAIGTLGGGALGAVAPQVAGRLAGRGGMLQSASNFGQRQVHSLTGVGDAKYVRSIGGGAADAQGRLQDARQALSQVKDVGSRGKALQQLETAQGAFDAAEKSERMGLTSIPGYARALMQNPRETLVTGVKDQWKSMTPGGRALMYGLPAVGAASELHQEHHNVDESGRERGRFERAGRILGGAASGALAPLAIAGDAVAGSALSAGGGLGGRALDRSLARLRQRRGPALPPSEPEPGAGGAGAEGYVTSDRAAGTAAESVTG